MVEMDRDRFCYVLHNLSSNAIKISPLDGLIQIRSRLYNGNVEIDAQVMKLAWSQ